MKALNVKECAASIKDKLKAEIDSLQLEPCLAIIQVGDNEASNRYVKNKIKDAQEIGVQTELHKLKEDVTQYELELTVLRLNADEAIHGIILQLPLPKHLNAQKAINLIVPEKDVDGLTFENIARLFTGESGFRSCTAEGCIRILDYFNIAIEGMTALVIGRSNLVGKPLAHMLMERGATVTIYHTKTPQMLKATDQPYYDLYFLCRGAPHAYDWMDFRESMLDNAPATIVDVGISFNEEGKLCGDFNPECDTKREPNIQYTPVPGGVGLMTRAILMEHVVLAARKAAFNE